MDIRNVTISTQIVYDGNDNTKYSALVLIIPLPGGEAKYTIPISDNMKSSIELAAKLTLQIED